MREIPQKPHERNPLNVGHAGKWVVIKAGTGRGRILPFLFSGLLPFLHPSRYTGQERTGRGAIRKTVLITRAGKLFVPGGIVIIFATAFLFPVKEGVRFVDPGAACLVTTECDVQCL